MTKQLSEMTNKELIKANNKLIKKIESRMTGKVSWFNEIKGYGFITTDKPFEFQGNNNCTEAFVHFSSIEGGGYQYLNDGQAVEFGIVDGPNGPQALSIIKLN